MATKQFVILYGGRRGIPGDKGIKGDEGPPGASINVRGVWSSGSAYAANDAVSADSSAVTGIRSLFIQRAGTETTASLTPPRDDPTRWLEVGPADLTNVTGALWRVNQAGHGFTAVGQPVTFDASANRWVLASNVAGSQAAVAVVREIVGPNEVVLQGSGEISNLDPSVIGPDPVAAFTPGRLYYASATPGVLTLTPTVFAVNFSANAMLLATGPTSGVVLQWQATPNVVGRRAAGYASFFYDATPGQTVLAGEDLNGATLQFTSAEQMRVLVDGADVSAYDGFTAANSTVTLAAALTGGERVEVRVLDEPLAAVVPSVALVADNIGTLFDGAQTRFPLTVNGGETVAPSPAQNTLVWIDGAAQEPYVDYQIVAGVDTESDIIFSAPPASGARFWAVVGIPSGSDLVTRVYLGALPSDPATDNAGRELIVGALYWNTVSNDLRVYVDSETGFESVVESAVASVSAVADAAIAARDAAQAAETGAVAARDIATSARDTALDARDAAIAARDGIDIAQIAAEAARDSALAAQGAAEAALTDFERQYLGGFSAPPATDNEGGALQEGALYWDTIAKALRVYDGSDWVDPASYKFVMRVDAPGASYTLSGADLARVITMSSASPNSVTLPASASVAIPVGTIATVQQIGTGPTTIQAAAGVMLNGELAGSETLGAQWSARTVLKVAADEWLAMGADAGSGGGGGAYEPGALVPSLRAPAHPSYIGAGTYRKADYPQISNLPALQIEAPFEPAYQMAASYAYDVAAAGLTCIAVGADFPAGAIISRDGGKTWSDLSVSALAGAYSYCYHIASDGNGVWIAVGSFGMIRSSNDGETWSSVGISIPSGVELTSVEYGMGVWVATTYTGTGAIHRSTDGGVTWVAIDTRITAQLTHVSTDGAGGWMLAGNNYFGQPMGARSTDNGLTWDFVGVGGAGASFLRRSAIYTNVWVVLVDMTSGNDQIWRSTDRGKTWAAALTTHVGGLYEIHADSDGTFYVGGDAGALLRSVDFGATWTDAAGGIGAARVEGISNAESAWLVATSQGSPNTMTIHRADYARASEAYIPASTVVYSVRDIASDGAGVWAVVGPDGRLARSTDNGASWTEGVSGFGTTSISAVATDGAGVWVIGGSSGKIARSTDNGASWTLGTSGFGTSSIYTVATDGAGVWVIAGESGKIARSTDNGASWTLGTSGFGTSSIRAVATDGAGVWVIGGSSGKIARSTDNGASWTLGTSGFGTSSLIETVATDGAGVWIAAAESSLRRSTDNGVVWSSVTEPVPTNHYIISVATDADGEWRAVSVQSSGEPGPVIVSRDNGITWIEDTDPSIANRTPLYVIAYGETGTWVAGGATTVVYVYDPAKPHFRVVPDLLSPFVGIFTGEQP